MKQRRSLLAWGIVLSVFVAVGGGGGCASGGSTQASQDAGGGDDATRTTDATTDSSMCAAGQTQCGSSCVDTGSSPMNCGSCGHVCPTANVCMAGHCVLGCPTGETLCGGPGEAGAPDAGTGGEAGASEAGSEEAGAEEAGSAAEGGSAEAGNEDGGDDASIADGGSAIDATVPGDAGTAYYCANTGSDPANCGGCGISCGPNRMCMNGQCSALQCPTGQVGCPATGTCIPTGTCCQSGDCTVTGEVCPMPGGTCACPSGESACSSGTFQQCISTAACCTQTDCKIPGQLCPVPGQTCTCDPSKQCCLPTDCPTEPNVGSASCTSNTCSVATCTMGCADIDGQFSNGCECCDDTNGRTCAAATAAPAALTVGGSTTFTGSIPEPTGGDWFQVSFSQQSNTSFHAELQFTSNPNNEFVFDVLPNCTGAPLSCGEAGTTCSARVQWEAFYATASPPADPSSPNFNPVPVPNTVWVHVYRASTTATPTSCGYTLKASE